MAEDSAMQLNLGQHISRQYNAELERLRSQVLRMGGMVEQQLEQAVAALCAGDREAAKQVRKGDRRINDLEVEIDADCTQIVARRQPTATDLRLVMGVVKTISDLERIGDEAKRIAKMVDPDLAGWLTDDLRRDLEHMGELAQGMLHDVLDAFARVDADDAITVAQRDNRVDDQYDSITRQLVDRMAKDSGTIPAAIGVLWAARSLERIGDRSQNIAEYLIHLVRGEDVRHLNLDELLGDTD